MVVFVCIICENGLLAKLYSDSKTCAIKTSSTFLVPAEVLQLPLLLPS